MDFCLSKKNSIYDTQKILIDFLLSSFSGLFMGTSVLGHGFISSYIACGIFAFFMYDFTLEIFLPRVHTHWRI